MKIRRYKRTCGEVLSDRVKIAFVQMGIEDDDLRRHLLMHAARLSTYPLVREEIRCIIMARDTLTGLAPIDVSAVYRGKGKDKQKDKDAVTGEMSPQARLQDIRERQGQEGCERRGASAWIDTLGRCGALGDTTTGEYDRAG